MTINSIGYEEIISILTDACSLTDGKKENLAIKRSFTKKQDIFSNRLHGPLLDYLSGNDEELKVVLDNLFTVLEEAMKNMSSSPLLLDMDKKTYNDEFKKELITPFTALLLFNMRFDFKKTSPIFYFIDFISKNSLTENCSLDVLVREYIKHQLKLCNLQHGIGDDFRKFIGNISPNEIFKLKTANKKVAELKEEYEGTQKGNTIVDFTELSLSLHGMRLVLYFKDHINNLTYCYNHAKNRTKHKDYSYWGTLEKIAKESIIRNNNKDGRFYRKFTTIISESESLSVNYHHGLDKKYNKHPNPILDYLMNSTFSRNFSCNLLERNEQLIDSVYYHILNVYIKVYDGQFDQAKNEIYTIIDKCEKHPSFRLTSFLSKLYIALHIKDNQKEIKNNNLDCYIYKAISTERFREKITFAPQASFLNQKSPFSNDAEFYTIIDSLSIWHEFIRDIQIDVTESPSHDISFTDKIEVTLKKIYSALDDREIELYEIKDEELNGLIKSTL